jgi:hypothetical protein
MSSSEEEDERQENSKAPTTIEQIIANGKKDGFYCVLIHSEQWEKTSEWIGPFDLETATFYSTRQDRAAKNGATLYKMEGGTTFSQKHGPDTIECHFLSIEDDDKILYGPFENLSEAYRFAAKLDESIANKCHPKRCHFILGNYGREIHYANWLEKHNEKEKAKKEKKAGEERAALEKQKLAEAAQKPKKKITKAPKKEITRKKKQ